VLHRVVPRSDNLEYLVSPNISHRLSFCCNEISVAMTVPRFRQELDSRSAVRRDSIGGSRGKDRRVPVGEADTIGPREKASSLLSLAQDRKKKYLLNSECLATQTNIIILVCPKYVSN
jgi:hypothetical protein